MNPPFHQHEGLAVGLLRDHIDTDAIIPSREMKGVGKTGLAEGLFANWRYRDPATREPEPGFVLNQHPQASILMAGRNFGCGSSREHAVWALKEWGIRVVIAPSFGAIFFDNCIRNGLLPLVLTAPLATPQRLRIDLDALTVLEADGSLHRFSLDDEPRDLLRSGLDPVALTLAQQGDALAAFEAQDRQQQPWLYL